MERRFDGDRIWYNKILFDFLWFWKLIGFVLHWDCMRVSIRTKLLCLFRYLKRLSYTERTAIKFLGRFGPCVVLYCPAQILGPTQVLRFTNDTLVIRAVYWRISISVNAAELPRISGLCGWFRVGSTGPVRVGFNEPAQGVCSGLRKGGESRGSGVQTGPNADLCRVIFERFWIDE